MSSGVDEACLHAVRDELRFRQLAREEGGQGLVWTGADAPQVRATAPSPTPAPALAQSAVPPPPSLPLPMTLIHFAQHRRRTGDGFSRLWVNVGTPRAA